jgi:hypothetical protein
MAREAIGHRHHVTMEVHRPLPFASRA